MTNSHESACATPPSRSTMPDGGQRRQHLLARHLRRDQPVDRRRASPPASPRGADRRRADRRRLLPSQAIDTSRPVRHEPRTRTDSVGRTLYIGPGVKGSRTAHEAAMQRVHRRTVVVVSPCCGHPTAWRYDLHPRWVCTITTLVWPHRPQYRGEIAPTSVSVPAPWRPESRTPHQSTIRVSCRSGQAAPRPVLARRVPAGSQTPRVETRCPRARPQDDEPVRAGEGSTLSERRSPLPAWNRHCRPSQLRNAHAGGSAMSSRRPVVRSPSPQ